MEKRRRRVVRFQLDMNKPEEQDLFDRLNVLKKARQFLPTIRDALTLLFSLMDGRVDVLTAMFPDLVEGIKAEGAAEERQRIDQERHRELIRLLESIRSSEATQPMLPVPRVRAQDDDDTEPVLTIKDADGGDAVRNFLDSMSAFD